MLISLIRNGFETNTFIVFLMMIPIILISLSFHEMCHGFVAFKCGDPTARNFGRLTLNPMKHLDPIGALMMLLVGFGWARPVPVNTRNLKNPKRDMALVALAGPVSNFLLAIISVFFLFLIIKFYPQVPTETSYKLFITIYEFFYLFAILNVGLAVFNLIPLPPLDGSRLVYYVLPPKIAHSYSKIEDYTRYIFLALILSSYIHLPIGRFNTLSDLLFFPVDWLRSTILELLFDFFNLFL